MDERPTIADLQEIGTIALRIICELAQEGSPDAEAALVQLAGTLIESIGDFQK